jgi:hypothetical protein
MLKRIEIVLFIILFLTSSCARVNPIEESPTLTSPSEKLTTITPSLTSISTVINLITPTMKNTLIPIGTSTQIGSQIPFVSQTPSPTETITPFPKFDINKTKQKTQFPPVKCPQIDPTVRISLTISDFNQYIINLAEKIQEYLDKGASFEQVAYEFNLALRWPGFIKIIDLTGDGIPELIIRQRADTQVISCDNGGYKTILVYPTGLKGISYPPIFSVQDMNLDGIPEVIIRFWEAAMAYVDILEWNGKKFISLIQANFGKDSPSTSTLARSLYWYTKEWSFYTRNTPAMNCFADIAIMDTDNNGTKELILSDGSPCHWETYYAHGPWRGKQVVFMWDGVQFIYSSIDMSLPEFRFQALQDADRYFLIGNYDRALQLYLEVIFNDKLDWWSVEKMTYIRESSMVRQSTPISPLPDITERKKLEAYSYFRFMIHHLLKGWRDDGELMYSTLIKNYPEDSMGYPFAEMARVFWIEYKNTKSLEQSCKPTITYVQNHKEILGALGDYDHGFQSHYYVPEDICPF